MHFGDIPDSDCHLRIVMCGSALQSFLTRLNSIIDEQIYLLGNTALIFKSSPPVANEDMMNTIDLRKKNEQLHCSPTIATPQRRTCPPEVDPQAHRHATRHDAHTSGVLAERSALKPQLPTP